MSAFGCKADVNHFATKLPFVAKAVEKLRGPKMRRKMEKAQLGDGGGLTGAGVRLTFRFARAARSSAINSFKKMPFWALLHIGLNLLRNVGFLERLFDYFSSSFKGRRKYILPRSVS